MAIQNAWLSGDWCGRGPHSYVAELREWYRRLTPEEQRKMYRPAVGDVHYNPSWASNEGQE